MQCLPSKNWFTRATPSVERNRTFWREAHGIHQRLPYLRTSYGRRRGHFLKIELSDASSPCKMTSRNLPTKACHASSLMTLSPKNRNACMLAGITSSTAAQRMKMLAMSPLYASRAYCTARCLVRHVSRGEVMLSYCQGMPAVT